MSFWGNGDDGSRGESESTESEDLPPSGPSGLLTRQMSAAVEAEDSEERSDDEDDEDDDDDDDDEYDSDEEYGQSRLELLMERLSFDRLGPKLYNLGSVSVASGKWFLRHGWFWMTIAVPMYQFYTRRLDREAMIARRRQPQMPLPFARPEHRSYAGVRGDVDPLADQTGTALGIPPFQADLNPNAPPSDAQRASAKALINSTPNPESVIDKNTDAFILTNTEKYARKI